MIKVCHGKAAAKALLQAAKNDEQGGGITSARAGDKKPLARERFSGKAHALADELLDMQTKTRLSWCQLAQCGGEMGGWLCAHVVYPHVVSV
ncbi:hypothetical protein DSM101010T_23280 [Desulfovibrio subterraneus]|uniref:Uncharacterized protein n=1 Tax=Desulfovibrio subterraneus TaxID=2718620 RepID=A0A7J0BJK1_9BACT|nr:hypothetical protein DSM101010T_23280 [Desulfovibrio subterraneus]